jgi:hypothetical protein
VTCTGSVCEPDLYRSIFAHYAALGVGAKDLDAAPSAVLGETTYFNALRKGRDLMRAYDQLCDYSGH